MDRARRRRGRFLPGLLAKTLLVEKKNFTPIKPRKALFRFAKGSVALSWVRRVCHDVVQLLAKRDSLKASSSKAGCDTRFWWWTECVHLAPRVARRWCSERQTRWYVSIFVTFCSETVAAELHHVGAKLSGPRSVVRRSGSRAARGGSPGFVANQPCIEP